MFWMMGCTNESDATPQPSGDHGWYDVGSSLSLQSDDPDIIAIGYSSDSPECSDSADNDNDGGNNYDVSSWDFYTGLCAKTDAECVEDFDNSEGLSENTPPDAYIAVNKVSDTEYELLKGNIFNLNSSWAPAVEFRISAPTEGASNFLIKEIFSNQVHFNGTIIGDFWIPEYNCGITGIEVYLSTAFSGSQSPTGYAKFAGDPLQNNGSFTVAGKIVVEDYIDNMDSCGIAMQLAGFNLEDYDVVYMAFRMYDPFLKGTVSSTEEPIPCTPAE